MNFLRFICICRIDTLYENKKSVISFGWGTITLVPIPVVEFHEYILHIINMVLSYLNHPSSQCVDRLFDYSDLEICIQII